LAVKEGYVEEIRAKIEREVGGWSGVEFRVNGHEIGHLHGGRMADLPFPVRMREELVGAGKAQVHHVLPQTGWVSYRIRQPEDGGGAHELCRQNYERLTARKGTGA